MKLVFNPSSVTRVLGAIQTFCNIKTSHYPDSRAGLFSRIHLLGNCVALS